MQRHNRTVLPIHRKAVRILVFCFLASLGNPLHTVRNVALGVLLGLHQIDVLICMVGQCLRLACTAYCPVIQIVLLCDLHTEAETVVISRIRCLGLGEDISFCILLQNDGLPDRRCSIDSADTGAFSIEDTSVGEAISGNGLPYQIALLRGNCCSQYDAALD